MLFATFATPATANSTLVYVTNSAGDNIDVIDSATNKVVQQIKGIEAAHGIGFAPDGSRVYVSDEANGTLDVFDRKSGSLITKVQLSDHPNNIAVTRDGRRILVGIARDSGALDVIDAATLSRTKSIPVHGRLHNVYVTPDGRYVITGSIRTKTITVINLIAVYAPWRSRPVPMGRPKGFSFSFRISTGL
jgi:YVTN family beta-propeller protein